MAADPESDPFGQEKTASRVNFRIGRDTGVRDLWRPHPRVGEYANKLFDGPCLWGFFVT